MNFFRANYRKPSKLQHPVVTSLGKGRCKNGSQGLSHQPPYPSPLTAVVMLACGVNLYTLVDAVFAAVAQLSVSFLILGLT